MTGRAFIMSARPSTATSVARDLPNPGFQSTEMWTGTHRRVWSSPSGWFMVHNQPMESIVLETERLTIRRFIEDDLPAIVAYRRDPAVARYQDWDEDWSLEDAHGHLEPDDGPEFGIRGRWTSFAVVERASGRLCGDVAVHFVEAQPSTVELGITFSGDFQGQGIAEEALRSVMAWLFSEFNLHRVFAYVDARNTPARSLLTRLGFRQEAELREADWFKGEWTTLCIYAVLASESRDQIPDTRFQGELS